MFEWLSERIEQAHSVFQEFSLDWTFILNAPATEAEIQACEVALGIPLPPSYQQFLLRYNGVHLFCIDQRETPDVSSYTLDSRIIIHSADNCRGRRAPTGWSYYLSLLSALETPLNLS